MLDSTARVFNSTNGQGRAGPRATHNTQHAARSTQHATCSTRAERSLVKPCARHAPRCYSRNSLPLRECGRSFIQGASSGCAPCSGAAARHTRRDHLTQDVWRRWAQRVLWPVWSSRPLSGRKNRACNTHACKQRYQEIGVKNVIYPAVLAISIALAGCAGSVKQATIYSPEETQRPPGVGFGGSDAKVGATGEISYCDAGLAFQVKSRKEQAYAAIAQACGGDDKYVVQGDLSSGGSAKTVVAGIETSCPGLAGRVIIFKCTGAKPRPTGLRPDQK